MKQSRRTHAFSLVEMLATVGVVALAVGLLGGTAWHTLSAMQLRGAAEEFLQTVKTARRYAVDHRRATRLTFREGLYETHAASMEESDERSYRLHTFAIPGSATGHPGQWRAVSGPLDDHKAEDAQEWVRVTELPRSPSLVGRWLACPLDPKVRRLPASVAVDAELLERFRQQPRAEFFGENFFVPETVWNAHGSDPYAATNCLSAYPENYRATPVDTGSVLLTGTLDDSEQCYDPMREEMVPASTFWPGTVQMIRGTANSKHAELPGLEFRPDGTLAASWASEIEVRFTYQDRPQPCYRVVIDAATGLARIVDEPHP